MTALQFGQCVAHHFLGQAGAFSTFTRNAQCFADFTITAAAFQNCIPDLTVGDTLAEANIHKLWTVAGLLLGAEELNVNENACQNSLRRFLGLSMSGESYSYFGDSIGFPSPEVSKAVGAASATSGTAGDEDRVDSRHLRG